MIENLMNQTAIWGEKFILVLISYHSQTVPQVKGPLVADFGQLNRGKKLELFSKELLRAALDD